MRDLKRTKILLLSLAAVLLLCFSLLQLRAENRPLPDHTCLGIPVITEEEISSQKQNQKDHYNQLFFEGQRVAMDRQTGTIYISQPVNSHTIPEDLQGVLSTNNIFCNVAFLDDPMFNDLDTAIAEGHPFRLVVQQPNSCYSLYNVVFTTFPVIRMDGDFYELLEDERKVYLGEMVVWNSDPTSRNYITKQTQSFWNVRGGLTTDYPKKSWRLSLVDEKRHKNNVSFLGLEADDDWILNPLVLDDTKIRDLYCMNLWNSLAEVAAWNPKMATGSYVELIKDGEYTGLFLLTRRLDAKYLNLQEDKDILLKGRPSWQSEDDGYLYEVSSSFLSQADSCTEVDAALSGKDNRINLKNYIDLNLLMQLSYGLDNCGTKNMYYLLTGQEDGFCLSWTPWDMDLTFANPYLDDPEAAYETALNGEAYRQEKQAVQQLYPDLDQQLALRWQELRLDSFSDEVLTRHFQQISDELAASGAVCRDAAIWEPINGNHDTETRLLQFILDRSLYLDSYFSSFLSQ